MSDTVVLDQPSQISSWFFLSAVSQLTSEVETGNNWYGKRSVYSGIRGKIIPADMLPARATKRNKVLALAMLLHDQPSSHVIDHGRKALATALAENGWQITIA